MLVYGKIEDNVLIECIPEDEETDIVIPEGVTKIENCDFSGCTAVFLPDSLKEIQNSFHGWVHFGRMARHEDIKADHVEFLVLYDVYIPFWWYCDAYIFLGVDDRSCFMDENVWNYLGVNNADDMIDYDSHSYSDGANDYYQAREKECVDEITHELNLILNRDFDTLYHKECICTRRDDLEVFDDISEDTRILRNEIISVIIMRMFEYYPNDEKISSFINQNLLKLIPTDDDWDYVTEYNDGIIDTILFAFSVIFENQNEEKTKIIEEILFADVFTDYTNSIKSEKISEAIIEVFRQYPDDKKISSFISQNLIELVSGNRIAGRYWKENLKEILFPFSAIFENQKEEKIKIIEKMFSYGSIVEPKKVLQAIIEVFRQYPDDEKLIGFINENIMDIFPVLMNEKGKIEILQKMMDSGKIFTEDMIDNAISYMIDNQQYEIQVMLTNYKYEHFKFDDPEKKLKL